MKVCIVGLSPNKGEWPADHEIWGLAWDPDALRMHRAFEMHEEMDRLDDWPQNRERLLMFPVLYLQKAHPEVPNGIAYPFDEVAKTTGAYWESSIAYLMALAIHEGATHITLVGVDMDQASEYGYQKPNMEYLIGLARGKGIEVSIPAESPLCKPSGMFGYIGRYGRVS